MRNTKIKRFTKIEKLACTIMIIGTAMIITAVIIASLRTDILCGIAVSGLFLAIIGIVLAAIYSSKEE